MIKDQMIADMTISLGSIDPCFSCTDRVLVVDGRARSHRVLARSEIEALGRGRRRP
jgi:hydrogenase-4 component G